MKRLIKNQHSHHCTGALTALALGLAAAAHAAPALNFSSNLNTAPNTTHRAVWGSRAASTQRAVWGSRKATPPRAPGATAVILKLAYGGLTPPRETMLRKLGADVTRRFDFINSVAATVPNRSLGQVAALPFVTHLSTDGQVQKCDEFTCASSGADTAYQQYGLDGTGVTVAVVDSGIVPAADFQGSYWSSRIQGAVSFVPNDPSTNDACGHGTHVAGIIAGNGAKSSGYGYTHTYYGAARNTNLVNVRVLDQNGIGSISTVLAGLQWVVQNKSAYNIRVINLSLGHPVGESYKTDPLCQAVEAAYKAGIVVVCAAGNNGRASLIQTANAANEGWGTAYGSIQSPANDPYVITVGATKSMDGNRAHDRIATYSSRGPSRLDLVLKPDIIAPGNMVISVCADGSTLDNYAGGTNDIPMSLYCRRPIPMPSPNYFRLSGTSMASPVVAGAAALLLQANPSLSPDTVKARLMVSADKWASPTGVFDPCTYGAGYLDIPAALKSTVVAGSAALSPTLTEDAKGNVTINKTTMLSSTSVIWGSSVIWGTSVIWGSSAVSSTSTLSASHVIWGSSVFSDSVIWGSSFSAADLSVTSVYGEGASVQTFQPNACH